MRKLTLDEIRADAARRGGKLVSETYVDSLTLMDWECAQGHRWRAVAHSIRQGASHDEGCSKALIAVQHPTEQLARVSSSERRTTGWWGSISSERMSQVSMSLLP